MPMVVARRAERQRQAPGATSQVSEVKMDDNRQSDEDRVPRALHGSSVGPVGTGHLEGRPADQVTEEVLNAACTGQVDVAVPQEPVRPVEAARDGEVGRRGTVADRGPPSGRSAVGGEHTGIIPLRRPACRSGVAHPPDDQFRPGLELIWARRPVIRSGSSAGEFRLKQGSQRLWMVVLEPRTSSRERVVIDHSGRSVNRPYQRQCPPEFDVSWG